MPEPQVTAPPRSHQPQEPDTGPSVPAAAPMLIFLFAENATAVEPNGRVAVGGGGVAVLEAAEEAGVARTGGVEGAVQGDPRGCSDQAIGHARCEDARCRTRVRNRMRVTLYGAVQVRECELGQAWKVQCLQH